MSKKRDEFFQCFHLCMVLTPVQTILISKQWKFADGKSVNSLNKYNALGIINFD